MAHALMLQLSFRFHTISPTDVRARATTKKTNYHTPRQQNGSTQTRFLMTEKKPQLLCPLRQLFHFLEISAWKFKSSSQINTSTADGPQLAY